MSSLCMMMTQIKQSLTFWSDLSSSFVILVPLDMSLVFPGAIFLLSSSRLFGASTVWTQSSSYRHTLLACDCYH